ncbi:MAG: type II CAAX endopeptidase family protein [Chloroflexota bacterium]
MLEIISMVLLFAPLIVIMFLANAAERARQQGEPSGILTAVSYGFLILFYLLFILAGLLLTASATLLTPDAASQAGLDIPFMASFIESLPLIGLSLWLPTLVGLIFLLPPVRRLLAQLIPIDPANHVHAIALAFMAIVVTNLLFTLGIGLDNLADLASSGASTGEQALLTQLWAQQLLMAVLAIVGIGWLLRRNGRSLWERLGLTGLSAQQWLMGLGIGLALVPLALGLDWVSSLFGWENADVQRLTEALLGPLFTSIPGILTLGLAAAIGEETLFRGALQPRFGLLLTSILFALLHSTYGISLATLVVFLIGLLLGWIRNRYNTTMAMVIHAVYNMSLGVISFLSTGI